MQSSEGVISLARRGHVHSTMPRLSALLLLGLATLASSGIGKGKLQPYKMAPPKKSMVGGMKDEDFRTGKPIVQRWKLPGAPQRLLSIQDVHAPEKVVWQTIMDIPGYKKMVGGVLACDVYSQKRTASGGKRVKARYHIRLVPKVTLSYHVEHHYEPLQHSMIFCLDDEKENQLLDMAGYWHVEQLPGDDKWSRVYFSSDALIPSWLSWAHDALIKQAAYKNLYWVEKYAEGKMGLSSRRRGALAQKVVIGGGAVAAGAVLWRRRSKNPRAGLVKPNDTPLNHLHRVNAAWEKL